MELRWLIREIKHKSDGGRIFVDYKKVLQYRTQETREWVDIPVIQDEEI